MYDFGDLYIFVYLTRNEIICIPLALIDFTSFSKLVVLLYIPTNSVEAGFTYFMLYLTILIECDVLIVTLMCTSLAMRLNIFLVYLLVVSHVVKCPGLLYSFTLFLPIFNCSCILI